MARQTTSPAKLTRPTIAEVVLRTRLFCRLEDACQGGMVWIAAPPGAGKTTLISSYLAEHRYPHLWYQLDAGDGDVATFFYYLTQAVKHLKPRQRKPLPGFGPEHFQGLVIFARRYFEELYSRFRAPFFLIFDNYQDVPHDALLHAVLERATAALPTGMSILFISRAAPPPPFARLRAHQRLGQLGEADLQLTLDEAKALAMLKRLTPVMRGAVPYLHAKTKGWTAGLVLLLEQIKGQQDVPREAQPDDRELLFDYFAGETLRTLPAAIQRALLISALLPRMTAQHLEQLSGLPDAGQMLAGLAHNNYFTYRYAPGEGVYQYHPLFREFLLAEGARRFPLDQLNALRRHAAALLEANGETIDAIALWQAAHAWPELTSLIGSEAPLMLLQGRGQTLEQWIQGVPAERMQQSPWLVYWLGCCRLPFDFMEARAYLEQAYRHFKAAQERAGVLLAWCGIVDTYIYERGDCTPLDYWIEQMEELLAEQADYPSPEIGARVSVALFCALMYRQPQHPAIRTWEERVKQLIMASPDESFRIAVGFPLLLYYTWWLADLGKATVLLNSLCAGRPTGEASALTLITWYATKGAYDWMNAAQQDCLETVQAGLDLAQKSGVHMLDVMLLAHSVHGQLSLDHLEAARIRLEAMRQIVHTTPARYMDRTHYHYLMMWECLKRNDLAQASEEAEQCLTYLNKTGTPFFQGVAYTSLGHAMLRLQRPEQAALYLERARAIAHLIGSKSVEYLYLLLEAEMNLFYSDDEAAGLAALRKMLAIGREHSIFNHGGWQSAQMAKLCVKALEHDIEIAHVQQLIRRRDLMPASPPIECEHWPWAVKVYTLGRFAIVHTGGEPANTGGKAQRRPLELLKGLLAAGGRRVPQEHLIMNLWPDAEGDVAQGALYTTVHRLRKLLGGEQAVVFQDGLLSLNNRYVWADVVACAWLLDKLDNALQHSADTRPEALLAWGQRIVKLYRGHFLDKDDTQPEVLAVRERLRQRGVRALSRLGDYLWKYPPCHAQVIELYQRSLEVHPLAEELYRCLMECYRDQQRIADALNVYERCRKALLTSLNAPPSRETEAVRTRLQ